MKKIAVVIVALAGVAGTVWFFAPSAATTSLAPVVEREQPEKATAYEPPQSSITTRPSPSRPIARQATKAAASPATSPPKPKPQYALPAGTQLKSGTVETPWDMIAPGGLVDTIGPENGRDFSRGMKAASYSKFRDCALGYQPPESMKNKGYWQGEVYLHVESVDGGYAVVDAPVGEAEFGDPALEACLQAAYKGARVDAAGAEPGKRYLIKYPVTFGFGLTKANTSHANTSR